MRAAVIVILATIAIVFGFSTLDASGSSTSPSDQRITRLETQVRTLDKRLRAETLLSLARDRVAGATLTQLNTTTSGMQAALLRLQSQLNTTSSRMQAALRRLQFNTQTSVPTSLVGGGAATTVSVNCLGTYRPVSGFYSPERGVVIPVVSRPTVTGWEVIFINNGGGTAATVGVTCVGGI